MDYIKSKIQKRANDLAQSNDPFFHPFRFAVGAALFALSLIGFSMAGNCTQWKSQGKAAWLLTLQVFAVVIGAFMIIGAFEHPLVDATAKFLGVPATPQ